MGGVSSDFKDTSGRKFNLQASGRQLEQNIHSLEKCSGHYQEMNLLRLEERLPPGIRADGFDFLLYDRKMPGLSLFREQYRIRQRGESTEEAKSSLRSDCFPAFPEESSLRAMPYRPEGLKINTGLGFSVRSKSELLICMKLRDAGFDFRYERPLQVGAIDLGNGVPVFWEHFGMLDVAYEEHMKSKIRQYVSAGYLPGKHIVFTYENLGKSLDGIDVEGIIRYLSALRKKLE